LDLSTNWKLFVLVVENLQGQRTNLALHLVSRFVGTTAGSSCFGFFLLCPPVSHLVQHFPVDAKGKKALGKAVDNVISYRWNHLGASGCDVCGDDQNDFVPISAIIVRFCAPICWHGVHDDSNGQATSNNTQRTKATVAQVTIFVTLKLSTVVKPSSVENLPPTYIDSSDKLRKIYLVCNSKGTS